MAEITSNSVDLSVCIVEPMGEKTHGSACIVVDRGVVMTKALTICTNSMAWKYHSKERHSRGSHSSSRDCHRNNVCNRSSECLLLVDMRATTSSVQQLRYHNDI